ncbi:MAG: aminotransferase class III-fold pyridoxal phosphate-dependent enzyme [Gemmatimonadales bacterium]|nr:aminotransferase class III-fold pyridoxal phosphate-dependent enzyme [Gemmatimonadales bacterium]NIN13324.1 aminotransferase class III-fold pyridoxal phosphate-dependent enzyme [Gemmatimonadales bacterium]NIN51327.1 aminotransferase class III-fold pyridoxal phosphate-dependent enzyme [Gemmatimonadales bacterium]NIP08791.1 aminotransferase class III-fold pyridoxal phosphate-dependent enzyme [Gemmatimonadales bacterium]NIQ99785.1 aminotransferase class III-fold pyridoxal phosphate-dependent en
MTVPGFSSTGSKRPEALFGISAGMPSRMVRAEGCRVWDVDGREYLDTVMALGAVALGYGHPAVVAAVERAARDGAVGSLAPLLEVEVAERLIAVVPGAEAVRFFKTGAEAVAAAIRIARVYTGHERVITCGYHGWLDWCQDAPGVPQGVRSLRRAVPFNDLEALHDALQVFEPVAAVVIEPVVDVAPTETFLRGARDAATRHGSVLIFDEIKTAFRIAVGGIAEQSGITPDLSVVGKALGNGLPIAAVCGGSALMDAVTRTWVSSTLATELTGLAAARAVLETFEKERVVDRLAHLGRIFHDDLRDLATRFPGLIKTVLGLPQMCYLAFVDDASGAAVARGAAQRGLLFKRTAYNFISLAHDEVILKTVAQRLAHALEEVKRSC